MARLECLELACRRGDFALTVERLIVGNGEKIALLGENGCGKTTLLHVLAGLLPAAGQIFHQDDGVPAMRWDRLSARRRSEHMAYLPQEASLLFNLSVGELIELTLKDKESTAARPAAHPGEEYRRQVLAATEMTAFLHRPYHSLSGGERRRAMLARTLCRGREFVFLDEPTAPLDMRHSALFMRHAAASEATVLAAMHDLNLAVRHFDRFLLMKEGRILFDRSKNELQATELEEIYGLKLNSCGDHFVPEL